MECIFHEVFHIFLIDCEKSKKTPKKLLPQKMTRTDTLTSNEQIFRQIALPNRHIRLQIDKMPEKEIFRQVCVNQKKAVTLSQSNKPKTTSNNIILIML